jgi:O-antigen ligase
VPSRLFEFSPSGNRLDMFGWNAKTPEGRTFGDIYHQQYRQMKGTTASKVSAVLFPLSVLAAIVLRGRGPWLPLVLGGVAVILFVITAVLTRRAHRAGRPPS